MESSILAIVLEIASAIPDLSDEAPGPFALGPLGGGPGDSMLTSRGLWQCTLGSSPTCEAASKRSGSHCSFRMEDPS